MLVYTAVNALYTTFKKYGYEEFKKFPPHNILVTFLVTKSEEEISYWKNNGKNRVLVDSGAFSFITGAVNFTDSQIKDYFKKYKQFAKKYDDNSIKGFFELDIDKHIGYDNVVSLREELFEVTDKVIPVWHESLGVEEFKKLCKEYSYVGVPCRNTEITYKELPHFVKYAYKNNCKLHGLGTTRKEVLNHIPIYSVDSTSWMTTRFGVHKKKKIDSDYLRNNYPKVVFLQYVDSIKFQQYYYDKWKLIHND